MRNTSLAELLSPTTATTATHKWGQANIEEVRWQSTVEWMADWIAEDRCRGAPHLYGAWAKRVAGGPAHPMGTTEILAAYLASDSIGTPTEPSPDKHIRGFVAEHLWSALVSEGVLVGRVPEQHHSPGWAVTDSGGDGLDIFKDDAGDLYFCLWEAKAHDTETSTVRDTANGACRQLDSNALRYLARYSKVGHEQTQHEYRTFYARLPEMWKDQSPQARGGVFVAANHTSDSDDCFGNIGSYWGFASADQRYGLLAVIENLNEFAKAVREVLWSGL